MNNKTYLYLINIFVNSVSGFDHTPLDERQENWHDHMFPFKLANYRKKLLTKPFRIGEIDYSCSQSTDLAESTNSIGKVIISGRCDCVAIWVDYDLKPAIAKSCGGVVHADRKNSNDTKHDSNVIEQYDESINDFQCHTKLSLKFFKQPVIVRKDESILTCLSTYSQGDSDFTYDFNFVECS